MRRKKPLLLKIYTTLYSQVINEVVSTIFKLTTVVNSSVTVFLFIQLLRVFHKILIPKSLNENVYVKMQKKSSRFGSMKT